MLIFNFILYTGDNTRPDYHSFTQLQDYRNRNFFNSNQQQVSQNNYLLHNSNNNNAWQRLNTKDYLNQQANRYPIGSQGWYATGGNHWKNNVQSIVSYPSLLIISILSLIICK